jgi:hypothetical protein
MQAGERVAWQWPQALCDESPPGSLERQRCAGMAAPGGLDHDFDQEPLLNVAPAEPLIRLSGRNHDRPFASRTLEKTGRAPADDLPASARGEAASVGPDRGVPRPPVGEVSRLGEERPDVSSRGQELALGFDPHRP